MHLDCKAYIFEELEMSFKACQAGPALQGEGWFYSKIMWRTLTVGIFDFVKDVGAMVGIGSAEAAPAAEDLKKEVEKHGLDAKDLKIEVDGDKVKVEGDVADQATKEKLIVAMGNVKGVAQVDETIKAASAEPEAAMYTVKSGDTLWAIASSHYGDGNKYPVIFEANKPMLSDPDKIYPGQMLRIPPV